MVLRRGSTLSANPNRCVTADCPRVTSLVPTSVQGRVSSQFPKAGDRVAKRRPPAQRPTIALNAEPEMMRAQTTGDSVNAQPTNRYRGIERR